MDRGDVRGDDQGLAAYRGHRRHADDGLAGAAGHHDDAVAGARRAPPGEGRRRVLLVRPERERRAVRPRRLEPERERVAVQQRGRVERRPAEPYQLALDGAALGQRYQEAVSVRRQELPELPGAGQLRPYEAVVAR